MLVLSCKMWTLGFDKLMIPLEPTLDSYASFKDRLIWQHPSCHNMLGNHKQQDAQHVEIIEQKASQAGYK